MRQEILSGTLNFVIITKEHAETLIMVSHPHDPIPLALWLCYPPSIFHRPFLFEIHLSLPVQISFRLHIPPSVHLLLPFHSFL